MDDFLFAGTFASDIGIVMREPFELKGAVPNVSESKVAGRNGTLRAWNGSFGNRAGTAKCFALNPSVCSQMGTIYGWLLGTEGYRRLEVQSLPGCYLMAEVSNGPEIAIRMEHLDPFSIKFTCKPQRFLKSGEQWVTFTAPGILRNPTAFNAKPRIEVHGAGTLTVGGTTVEVKSGPVILDCDTQNAYFGSLNMNGSIYAPEFPELLPGDNEITWDGGISEVSILPRWWTL